jgi:hypothetical protein
MNRRNFLAMLAASLGWLLLPGKKAIAGQGQLPGLVPLCNCPVAGFQYHEGPNLLSSLRNGQRLLLRREPDNPYDPLAIAVRTESGKKLGDLPRRLNEIPARLMDDGHRLAAVIVAVDQGALLWEMVEMEVRLG